MSVDLHHLESGDGPPVVLLHAFPLSAALWSEQRTGLADRYRVIAPDLRGFGGSALGSDEPSLDLMAEDVVALLDKLNLDQVVLGGLSMGGYVSMALLRAAPERVRALVLADTKAASDTPEAKQKRAEVAAAMEGDDPAATLTERVLPPLLGTTTERERPMVAGRVRALVQSAPPPAVAWAARAMAERPDSTATLSDVRVPSLVLVGEEDVLTPPSDAQSLVDVLPNAQLVQLPGAGHLSAVETPEEFTRSLRQFLDGLPA
jgi:pimeloyl-ACP methyl ester carboxylesterase